MSTKCKYCGAEITFLRSGFKFIPMKDGDRHSCIPRNVEADKARQREDLEKAADLFLAKSYRRAASKGRSRGRA